MRRLVGSAQTWAAVALLAMMSLSSGQALRLKRVGGLQTGTLWNWVLCGDTDHDSAPEMMWRGHGWLWEIREYQPVNRYRLVYADTAHWPLHGIEPGSFQPFSIGDMDHDSLTDLLGFLVEGDSQNYRWDIGILESPTLHSYPDSLVWYYNQLNPEGADFSPCYAPGDLDNDGKTDLYCNDPYDCMLYIFENEGNNQYRVAWDSAAPVGPTAAFGDFDLDEHKEWVTAGSSTAGPVWLYENTGDDAYSRVWVDSVHIPNGSDVFSGNDLDGDGKPEFFVCFAWFPSSIADFYLYMWETTGNDAYERTLIDHKTSGVGMDWAANSMCGDVDGDGKDELIWSTGTDVYVYKATGNNQFTQVWQWHNPTGCDIKTAMTNIYDLNSNGYNELVVSGVLRGTPGYPRESTCVFEVEAVQVVEPNGGQTLVPGETCQIRWRTFSPPRCDSVSLFLRSDTTIINGFYRLDTIAHGLSPSESTYSWVVPDTTLDSARIVAIAYGPGWQFDESDSAFAIMPGGVAEAQPVVPRNWALVVSPNPARSAFSVRFEVPRQSRVSVGVYDVDGRLVKSLSDGDVAPGRYESKLAPGALPAGIYFCRLAAGGQRFSRKVVLTE